MVNQIEEGDVVLCTVDRIVGTVVFVKIEGNGEGSIVISEIAPGRIRNLRDYVVPKKKIVCKVLKIGSSGNIYLSLRRVKEKEKKQVLDEHKQEKSAKSIFKSILKKDSEKILSQLKDQKISDFLKESKENPKKLEKLVGKKYASQILEILEKQKQKKAVIKKELFIKTEDAEGISQIKKLFSDIKPAEAKYISAGKYLIKIQSTDAKTASQELQKIIENLEKKAKNQNTEFSIK